MKPFQELSEPNKFWSENNYRKKLIQYLRKLKNDEDQLAKQCCSAFESGLVYLRDTPKMSPISAQLENCLYAELLSHIAFWQNKWSVSEENLKKLNKEEMYVLFGLETFRALFHNIFSLIEKYDKETRPKISLTMNQIPLNDRADSVENLFYTAWRATADTIDAGTLKNYMDVDGETLSAFLRMKFSNNLHRHCQNKDNFKDYDYHLTGVTMDQVSTLAKISAVQVKLGPEMQTHLSDDQSSLVYGNTAFLRYLIARARTAALRNIKECRDNNIPCLAAMTSFEGAELNCHKDNADKVHDVLEKYWLASLQSKALLMSFIP